MFSPLRCGAAYFSRVFSHEILIFFAMLHRYEGTVKEKRKQKVDAEFTAARTEQVRARTEQAKMLLAKARGELILKSLAEKQATYLVVALRQRILGIPRRRGASLRSRRQSRGSNSWCPVR
jgi:hypothetical protein